MIHHIGTSNNGHRLAARLNDDAPGPQWVSTVDGDWIEVPGDYAAVVERAAASAARACLAAGSQAGDSDASAAWSNTTLRGIGLDLAREEIEALNDDAGHDALWQIYARAWRETVDAA